MCKKQNKSNEVKKNPPVTTKQCLSEINGRGKKKLSKSDFLGMCKNSQRSFFFLKPKMKYTTNSNTVENQFSVGIFCTNNHDTSFLG